MIFFLLDQNRGAPLVKKVLIFVEVRSMVLTLPLRIIASCPRILEKIFHFNYVIVVELQESVRSLNSAPQIRPPLTCR